MHNNQNQQGQGQHQGMEGGHQGNPYYHSAPPSRNVYHEGGGFGTYDPHGSHNMSFGHPGNPGPYNHHNHGLYSWFNFKDNEYMKGFVMGAAGTYLATNENVQKSIARYLVGMWMNVQESVEEFKEKIEDAKAEFESENK